MQSGFTKHKTGGSTFDEKGLTIIELVIALAIMLIAIALGYTFVTYNTKSQALVETQSAMQQNVILAKNMIDQNLRQASYIVIAADGESVPAEGWEQVFYLTEADGKGTIMHRKVDGTEQPLLGRLAKGYNMYLSFRKIDDSFVEVSVTCDKGDEYEYNITSEILILGIDPGMLLGEEGNIIYFK